tara:strand:- start:73 stop:801 length:729 start_codon:yes stop_codon:yes gene_type:complete
MALTKVGKEGVVGLDNSADATAITISSGEVVTLSNNLITNGNVLRGANDSSNTLSGGTASNSGSNIAVYGSSHSSLASNIRFRSGSTVTMLMDSTGAMTKPLQPAFHAHKNGTDVTDLVTGDSTITWSDERFDQNGDFSGSTFTAPVTGKYFLQLNIRFQEVDISADYLYLSIKTSNQDYSFLLDPDFGDSDPAYYTISLSVFADMDANDTSYIRYSQSGGAAQVDIDGNQEYTWFEGHLVC